VDLTLPTKVVAWAAVGLFLSVVLGVGLELSGVADGGYVVNLVSAATGFALALVIANPILRRLHTGASEQALEAVRRQAHQTAKALAGVVIDSYSAEYEATDRAVRSAVTQLGELQEATRALAWNLHSEATRDAPDRELLARVGRDLAVVAPTGHEAPLVAARLLSSTYFPRAIAGQEHRRHAGQYLAVVAELELAVGLLEVTVAKHRPLVDAANRQRESGGANEASVPAMVVVLLRDQSLDMLSRLGLGQPGKSESLVSAAAVELSLIIEVLEPIERLLSALRRDRLVVTPFGEAARKEDFARA
jgi:hypothetical protein